MSATFPACARGDHRVCPRALHVQSAWATAGLAPVAGVPATTWQECGCDCHAKGVAHV